jgi:hypothetical protein
MLPSPMIPRLCPRGLWESAAALVWQSLKSAADERADCVHLEPVRVVWRVEMGGVAYQVKFRKVARMRKMAKSATASEDAAALGNVRCHVLDEQASQWANQRTCCNI